MSKKSLFTHPIMQKGSPHNIHEQRAFKKAKLKKDLDECDERYIKEEIDEFKEKSIDKAAN